MPCRAEYRGHVSPKEKGPRSGALPSLAVARFGKLACRTEQKQRKHDATTDYDPTKRPVRLETRVAARLLGRPTCVRERSSAWLKRQR